MHIANTHERPIPSPSRGTTVACPSGVSKALLLRFHIYTGHVQESVEEKWDLRASAVMGRSGGEVHPQAADSLPARTGF